MPYSPSISPASLPGGLQVPSFGSVGGAYANQQVVRTLFDYNPFAIYRAVADRHSSMPSFRQMLRMQNAERGVNAPTTGHYERDWKVQLIKFGTVQTAAAGAGNDLVINLHSDSMFNAGATVSGSAAQASYIRVGDIIQAPDGVRARVKTKNTSVTPHRVTLTPLKAADDLDTSILASSTYSIFDNAWGEASGLPEGLLPRVTKYTNTFQIVKEGFGASGTELTNQLFVQFVPGQDGSIGLAMQDDAMFRYERAMCYTLLFGTQIDNITELNSDLGHDVDITGTEGLIPFIETNGHTDTYTAGSYGITDFDNLAVIFEQERIGTRRIMMYQGFTIYQEVENALQSLLNANLTIELTKMLGGDAGIPMDDMQPFSNQDFSFYIGFSALKKSGYEFYFRLLNEFNEYVGAGAPGYDFPSYNVCVPLGFTTDKAAGNSVPYVSYEYKEQNGYRRLDVAGTYAGVGTGGSGGFIPFTSNAIDLVRGGIVSEIAGHFACPNKAVIQKPS